MVPIEKSFKFEKQIETRKTPRDLGVVQGTSVIAGAPTEVSANGVVLDPTRNQLTEEELRKIQTK